MKSLAQLIDDSPSRAQLLERLIPKRRVIYLEPIVKDEDLQESIESIISMSSRAIEQQNEFLVFKLLTSSSKLVSNKYRYLKFPYFGKQTMTMTAANGTDPCKANGQNVSILLTLLRTISQRLALRETSTIRDIFYSNVELYVTQRKVTYWLSIINNNFQLNDRRCIAANTLNIVPAQKGLIFTNLPIQIERNGSSSDKYVIPLNTSSLIPYLNESDHVTLVEEPDSIIILEKEAIYSKLVQRFSRSQLDQKIIIITGKGYPDTLTKTLVNKLGKYCKSVYVDADPYGINITVSYLSSSLERDSIQYGGVPVTALIKRGGQLLPYNERDFAMAQGTLRRLQGLGVLNDRSKDLTRTMPTVVKQLRTELQRQLFFGKKGEMNSMYLQD